MKSLAERRGDRGLRGAGPFAAVLALAVAACASPDLPRHAEGPGRAPPPPPPTAERKPVSDTPVKVGKPYQIANIWYYPEDDRAYDAVGMASWYGPGFHGAATANGEQYDQHIFGAAHKTLPMPSYVEVTALDTGRTILVRINDRGPFVGDRIIDLSHRSAEALGIAHRGVSRVRVRRVEPPEGDRAALRAGRAASPRRDATPTEIAMLTDRLRAQAALAPPPLLVGDFIQVAAFADRLRAEAVGRELNAAITYAGTLWRVRLGPFFDDASAQAALARVRAQGYQDAALVARPAP